MTRKTSKVPANPSRTYDEPWLWAESASTGKWLVFVEPAEADHTWTLVAKATEKGLLGFESKCSTMYAKETERRSGDFVICCYCLDDDAEGGAGLRHVLAGLRGIGLSQVLRWKSNTATRAKHYGAGSILYVSDAGSCDYHRAESPSDYREEPF